jgi:Modifier of rudimentary (Mod(r)) protein
VRRGGRSSDYAAAKEAFDGKYARQEAVLAKLRPDKLLDSLGAKINEAEQASEELQDKFLRGEVPLDAFVEGYLRHRIQYHQRDLKRQAASQQLL